MIEVLLIVGGSMVLCGCIALMLWSELQIPGVSEPGCKSKRKQ
jgi:hypothetical protein